VTHRDPEAGHSAQAHREPTLQRVGISCGANSLAMSLPLIAGHVLVLRTWVRRPVDLPLPQRRHSVRLPQAFGLIWGQDFRCLDFLSPGHASDGFRDVRTLPFGFLDIQAPPGDLAIADAHDDHAAFL
jgi:hypothetical protein